jgi:hypothetical protein
MLWLLFFFSRVADSYCGCGLNRRYREWPGGWRGCGICGNFLDHVALATIETGLGGVAGGYAERAQDEAGAGDIDLIADEGVDDFHERGLDGFLILEHGDGMKARLGRSAHTADHPLMEITEDFTA